eukprot:TRINITY_DN803_c0_g1::TRINITY_DN803_c0_g1_i1::g.25298::m.25298 TRINITY_DN803_c0_g1::TRINITY_DN803_c0_g1_i1::g.25298  ORF type:complete len:143 (+),score=-4.88,sp/P41900/T2FB_DROME/28.16/1e-06,TFIIF_beta/PF02270.10/8.4e-14,DUF3512/PF12024.3/0.11,Cyclin_C/PF02984.14/0.11 TRINITY_DN803_c0_g1_i1:309-737(+)
MTVEGAVQHLATMTSENPDLYIKKPPTETILEQTRSTMEWAEHQELRLRQPIIVKRRPEDREARPRRTKEETTDLVFKAFGHKSQWTTKSLEQYTGVQQNALKAVLDDICDYIKRGGTRNTWQLKPQYASVHDPASENSQPS